MRKIGVIETATTWIALGAFWTVGACSSWTTARQVPLASAPAARHPDRSAAAAEDSQLGPISPEAASPRSRKLMSDGWLWHTADDNSPLGNDTGADTVALFREWRSEHQSESPLVFLAQLLQRWEVPDDGWNVIDPAVLKAQLKTDHFAILTRDDTVIALAFAQLILDGHVEPSLRERAVSAVQRQALPEVITFRGWSSPAERAERLERMAGILTRTVD